MPETSLALFDQSLDRCLGKPEFVDRFYERFMASSEEVAAKFAKTDFARQHRILRSSLHMMLRAAQGHDDGVAHLDDIARSHSRAELDIPPHLYDLWLSCLVDVVRELDPACNDAIAEAWRAALAPAIATMRARY